MADDIITRDSQGNLAVNMVTATEASVPYNCDDCFTLDAQGRRALRVVVNGSSHGGDTISFDTDGIYCDWKKLSEFLSTQTASYNSIVSGKMTYFESYGLWRIVFKNASGATVLEYQQYTPDWEQVGFAFTKTFTEGTVVNFVRTNDEIVVATPPTKDGTYVLKAFVSNGSITTKWIAE